MPEFLSAEWIADLDAAARSSTELADAADAPVAVQLEVAGADGSTVRYHLVLGPGPARVHPGAASAPDLTLVTDLEAATAIRIGTANAQQCLADGRLRLRGNPEVLTRRVGVLGKVGDLFAAARR